MYELWVTLDGRAFRCGWNSDLTLLRDACATCAHPRVWIVGPNGWFEIWK